MADVVRRLGDQSRAVEGGLPADYVHFSLETDVTRLVDAGLVAEDWKAGRTRVSSPSRWSCSWSGKETPRTSRAGTTS